MGYDNPQRGSGGSAVAIVAVIVVVLLGGLVFLGVGALFFVRTARMEATEVQMVARVEADRAVAEMEKTEQLATRVQVKESMKMEMRDASIEELVVEIDQDGAITVDEERMDLDGLRERLQEIGEDGNVRLTAQIRVDPLCQAQHVVAVQSVCSEFDVEDVQLSTLELPSAATDDEGASTAEAVEFRH